MVGLHGGQCTKVASIQRAYGSRDQRLLDKSVNAPAFQFSPWSADEFYYIKRNAKLSSCVAVLIAG